MIPPLVLTGLRGSGKTTVGRLLAGVVGLPFRDTDALVEEEVGLPVARIFAVHGEAAFREWEARVVARLTAESWEGVLATGGGVVLSRQSRRRLRAWGFVVFLDAPVPVLADRIRGSDRPSLTGAAVEDELLDLERVRRPLYEAAAHERVDASGPARDVAEAVLRAWQARWT